MPREPRSPTLRPGIRRLMGLDVPRKGVIEAQLEEELRLHLDLRAEQLMRQGLSPEQALARAREQFGAIDEARRDNHRYAQTQEQSMRRRIAIDSLLQDIRFAFRMLGRQKAWTALAIVALALGIGANTAVFSVVNDLLLDPMRYPQPSRLIRIARHDVKSGFEMSPTRKLLAAWKSARTITGVEGVATTDVTMMSGDEPRAASAAQISPMFVQFAGAHVLLGRTFDSTETLKGAAPVAILSEHVWHDQFGGSNSVLGKTITIDGKDRAVVGVLGDGVRLPTYSAEPTDLWLPLTDDAPFLSGPLVARLAPGATIESAQQELGAIGRRVSEAEKSRASASFDIVVRTPGTTGPTRQSLLMLVGAVCILLLVACANVAHLLLARGAAREREIAIRAALGAGRGRIARQLMTESMLLALAGCAAGLGFGAVALRIMIALRPPNMSELMNVHIDSRVLAVTIFVSILSGLLFGMVAGMHGGARSFGILRSSAAGSNDRRRSRLQSFLVVSESALSVVLLVGAMLLIRTVMNLQGTNPGFDPTNVYAMPVRLPDARYPSPANRDLFASQLLDQANRVPGVTEATVASNVPMRAGVIIGKWVAEGAATASDNGSDFTAMNTVRGEYFKVMRMPLVSGRSFDKTSANRNEIIISQSLARQLWGDRDPVGLRMRIKSETDKENTWSTVIGAVADANLLGLGESGRIPAVYYPAASVDPEFTLIVRMKPGTTPHTTLRTISRTLDPTTPPPTTLSVSDLLAKSIASKLFIMTLLTLFAGLAVALCAIGLYGVITYMVSQSTREIGIRVALGAARRDVVRMVMSKGIALSAIGLVIGIGASVWGTKLLTSNLYGVTPTDPVSFVAGASVLLGLAVVACISPTIRALRIDPMVAMRSE